MRFLLALLLASYACIAYPIEIESLLLKKLDGSDRFVNLVIKCRSLHEKLKLLQLGKTGKQGFIVFKDKHYTVRELAEINDDLPTHETRDVLKETVNTIIKLAGSALEKMHKHQQQFVEIVNQWTKQRNKPHNPVLLWAHIGDNRFIAEYLTSFKALDTFLTDVILLLEDLRETLKKSDVVAEEWIQRYKETHRKA